MLKGSLYTIDEVKQPEEGHYIAKISLNAGHEIFKGHFPQQPVLPGVCLLEMLKEIIEQETGRDCFLSEGTNIKYVKLVDPTVDDHLEFDITIKEGVNVMTVVASTFLESGEANFKFKGLFELK